MEQESIDQLCELKKLKQFDIQPDGHCLFASILDQLKLRHDPKKLDQDMDVMKLRWLSCNYVQEHRDDFIPYLFDEETMKMKTLMSIRKSWSIQLNGVVKLRFWLSLTFSTAPLAF